MIYAQGTLSTVSGSAVVRGMGTQWKSNINGIAAGQIISIQTDNAIVQNVIQSVNSDTELILAFEISVTLNHTRYVISTTVPDTVSDGVRQMVAINSYITLFLQNMDKWMSQDGAIKVTLPNGQVVSLQSIRALQAAMDGKLDKKRNGTDIPDKGQFVNNIGLGNALKAGEYGIGSTAGRAITNGDYNNAVVCGVYAGPGAPGKNSLGNAKYGSLLVLNRNADHIYQQANFQSQFCYRYRELGTWTDWWTVWSTANTSIVDGYLKTASPVIKIWGNGRFETNSESAGATVEHLSEGIYLINNVLGLHADAAWGGVDGGIDIPLCKNKLPLIWVNYEVLPDGAIKIMTYHREHPTAPAFAKNARNGYSDGDLVDIPAGRSISVRVQMPENSVWNVRQKAVESAIESKSP